MRRLLVHAARPVDELKLVRINIKVARHAQSHLGRLGCIQKFTLGTYRNELARRHRKRTREQPGNPRKQHHRAGRARGRNTYRQRQIRDQPVVRAEHRRAEVAREFFASAGGQGADDFFVNSLVSRHFFGGVRIFGVGGAGFGKLSHRQNKNRPEMPRKELQNRRRQ